MGIAVGLHSTLHDGKLLMGSGTAVIEKAGATSPWSGNAGVAEPGPAAILVLPAWGGLVSGLLEVATFALRKQFFDVNQFAWTTRHFVWLIPLVNLAIFLVLGLILAVPVSLGSRRARWLATRLLGA